MVATYTWQDVRVTIFAEVAFHVCLCVVWLGVAWGHLGNQLCWEKYDYDYKINVAKFLYVELFGVSSFSICSFVESTDDNPQIRSSDLCISTQY